MKNLIAFVLLSLLLITACARRKERNGWSEYTDEQKEAIQNAHKEACVSGKTDIKNELKAEMGKLFATGGNGTFKDGAIYEVSDGSKSATVTIIRTGAAPTDLDTIYFLVEEGSLQSLEDYNVFATNNNSNRVFKYKKSDNDEHIDAIIDASCQRGDAENSSDGTFTIENSSNDSATNFQLTLKKKIPDNTETDIYQYDFPINDGYPAIFMFFQVKFNLTEEDENGNSTGDPTSVQYSIQKKSKTQDLDNDDFVIKVQSAHLCEYNSFGYQTSTNKAFDFLSASSSDCVDNGGATVPGYTVAP